MGKRAVLTVFLSLILVALVVLVYAGFFLNSFLYPAVYVQTFEEAGVYDFVEQAIEKTPNTGFIVNQFNPRKIIFFVPQDS